MGFTGLLILARAEAPLTDLDPLAGHDAELVGRHANDDWQLAAVTGHTQDTPAWAAALVDATTAPVLIAVVDDSDTALLLADSPEGHRWITVLNAPADSAGRAAVADSRAMTAIAETAVAWAAEAGHTVTTEPVLEAFCAADRDNRAADQAFSDALDASDFAATNEVVRNQISFIEVYVLRVLTVLGLSMPAAEADSWWAHLASQVQTHSP
ncbi:MAG: hypothetical protein JOZ47_04375 [Kutzneria sp.]|nr:hypothetical protein [Kutzneria sp.]